MGAVERDVALGIFWTALVAGSLSCSVTMYWIWYRTRDIVALMFANAAAWLAVAFTINTFVRLLDVHPATQTNIVFWQRASFAMCVVFVVMGTQAMWKAHNGNLPFVRVLLRRFEKERKDAG